MNQPNPFTRIAIILAGGAGERFWPLSRRCHPKQLLCLASKDQTLLAEAIERIAPLIPRERIFIITSRALVEPIRQALTSLPPENVIGEPCKRNTAGALTYAAAQMIARYGEPDAARISMAILTADHRIDDPARFRATVEAALAAAEQDGALATIGVGPTRPETGYGYIEVPENIEPIIYGADWPPVYPVERFREKPDLATAEHFLATGRFFWNSGMFFWRLDRFLDELDLATPAYAEAARAMASLNLAGNSDQADRIFETLEDISIDYALMEHARNVVTVRADFAWDDIGAWDALDRGYPHDAQGNVTIGDPVLIDVKDSIVYNEPGAPKMAVSVIGVEGLAIVVSGDAVLVVPKDRAQEVKRAVNELKKRGAGQL